MGKNRVLVLNCDSFAAVTQEDARRRAGFKANEQELLFKDFGQGPHFNRFMSLPSILSEHVLFNAFDLADKDLDKYAKPDLKGEDIRNFFKNFEFYSLGEYGHFDKDFIKDHFDSIFYFFHLEFDPHNAINEELCSLVTSRDAPKFMVFNFRIKKVLLDTISQNKDLLNFTKDSDAAQRPFCCSEGAFIGLHANAYSLSQVLSRASTIFMIKQEPRVSYYEPEVDYDGEDEDEYAEAVARAEAKAAAIAERENYADASDLEAFFSKLKKMGIIKRSPKIIETYNGYLNFRVEEAKRSVAATTALVESLSQSGILQDEKSDGLILSTPKDAPKDPDALEYSISGDAYTLSKRPITILLSSELFNRHPYFQISPWASLLVMDLIKTFPGCKIKLLLNANAYSYLTKVNSEECLTAYAKKCFAVANQARSESDESKKFSYRKAFQEMQMLSEHEVSKTQLCSELTSFINEAINLFIRFDLFFASDCDVIGSEEFIEYEKTQVAKDALDEFINPIDQCVVLRNYDDFVAEDYDLLLSDSFYEQMLGVSAGKAVIGIYDDLDKDEVVKDFDWQIYSDFLPNAKLGEDEDYEFVYMMLKQLGMMRKFIPIGRYKHPTKRSFGLDNFVCQVPMSSIVAGFLANEMTENMVDWRTSKLDDRLSQYYKDKMIFVDELKSCFEDVFSQSVGHGGNVSYKSEQLPKSVSSRVDGVNNLTTSQQSNYTEALRYHVHWLFLSYFARLQQYKKKGITNFAGCNVLSFGCSRGREASDLVSFFPESNILGIDINKDAIERAITLRNNIAVDEPISAVSRSRPKGMRKVKVMGNNAYMDFATTEQFFASMDEYGAAGKFDVVTVMTVLCRHPQTVGLQSSKGVYEFSEFDTTLKLIDSLVSTGGLLCVFNTNYKLLDSSIANKYLPLFPFDDLADFASYETKSDKGFWTGDDVNKIKSLVGKLAERHSLKDQYDNDQLIELPQYLIEGYFTASKFGKFGYVSMFDKDGNCIPRSNIPSIYLKVSD